jgi:hypothetical protein
MERIEELLMDMLDDGPLDGSADVGTVSTFDASLQRELEAMRGQSVLLTACKEPIQEHNLAALAEQRATLRATLLGDRVDVQAAILWSGAVVVVASCISIAANAWFPLPQPMFEEPPRYATLPATESVSTSNNALPALRQQPPVLHSAPASSRPQASLESNAEREVLVQRRDELLATARGAAPDVAYHLYRDVYRVSDLLHDAKTVRSALRSALACAEAAGMTDEAEQCRQDLMTLDQR